MVLVRKRKVSLTATLYYGKRARKTIFSRKYRSKSAEEIIPDKHEQPFTETACTSSTPSFTSTSKEDTYTDSAIKPEVEPKKSKYTSLKEQRVEGWTELRDVLFNTYLSSEAPLSEACQQCDEESQLYRCLDCAQWEILCEGCIQRRHQHPHLHMFEAWRNETFVGAVLETPSWILGSHNDCDTNFFKSIVVVDEKGRQHLRNIQFCKCEQEAATLVRYSLWPSSAKFPKLAFSFELLKWLNGLLIECHVSVKGFCEALKFRCSKHHRNYVNFQISDVYKSLISETVTEFRHFIHRKEQPSNLCENLDDVTQCPACFSIQPKIYSFDADFQLVRKASSGKQWEQPKHKGHFFLDQNLVDSFIANYNTDKGKPDVDCSEFQAGSSIRSKSKNNKLAETAVFGSTCRHEFPKYFFSLKHGERLGYSVYLLKKLLEEKPNDSFPLYVMYDIACSLESHLKKQGNHRLLEKVKFSIPIFHSYGHKMACQVLYGPRRTRGLGLTDGESLERLWSYLGKFSKITKEMTPENRIDLLVDGLIHYGQKIRDKLCITLPGKLEKAEALEATSAEGLQDLLKPLSGVTNEVVQEWIDEEKETFSCNHSDQKWAFTPQEEYCLELADMHEQRENILPAKLEENSTFKKLKTSVKKREKTLKISWDSSEEIFKSSLATAKEKKRKLLLCKLQSNTAERHFLLELIKKYARGQAIAIRLSRQIKKIVTKINQTIKEYNAVGVPQTSLPLTLSYNDVKDPTNTVWQAIEQNDTAYPPATIKRQAIYLKSLVERAVEEQNLVRNEMISTLQWYQNQHSMLLEAHEISKGGKKSCIMKEGLYVESRLQLLHKHFGNYITDLTEIENSFFEMVGRENNMVDLNNDEFFLDEDEEDTDDQNDDTDDENDEGHTDVEDDDVDKDDDDDTNL